MSASFGPPTRDENATLIRWGCWLGAVLVLIVVAGGLISFTLGWLAIPGKVLDPNENLARWQWYYDTYQGEKALGANIQQADKTLSQFRLDNGDPSGWNFSQTGEYSREVTVRDGYIVQYNTVAQKYNAKMRDITRSLIRPPELPTCIPNWETDHCAY